MAQVKFIEIAFEDGLESAVFQTHGMTAVGIKNPGKADLRFSLQAGFTGDEQMYDIIKKTGGRDFYTVRASSFVPLEQVSVSNIERIRLLADIDSSGNDVAAEPVHLILAFRD